MKHCRSQPQLRYRGLLRLLIISGLLGSIPLPAKADEAVYQAIHFDAHAGPVHSLEPAPGLHHRTLKKVTPAEAQRWINTSCSHFTGAPCTVSNIDAAITKSLGIIHLHQEPYYADWEVGVVVMPSYRTWKGLFYAPRGFAICRISLNKRTGRLTKNTVFTASLQDEGQELAYYASVAGEPNALIDFMIYVVILPSSTPSSADCMKDGPLWTCGQRETPLGHRNCREKQPGAVVEIDDGHRPN